MLPMPFAEVSLEKFKKFLNLVIFVPLGIVLVVLAVANRQVVTLALNPFRPEDSVLSLSGPFFLFLLLSLLLGILIGSMATWWTQGRYRRQARQEAREVIRWQAEADRQKYAAQASGSPQLPSR
jgi:uncharacterized integral membrane protein